MKHMIKCLEQHVMDRGLDINTTCYWVCAYANNQHKLGGEISSDPADSSFRKAMRLCKGTVSIVDSSCTIYSRIWCNYEVFVSIEKNQDGVDNDYKFDVYTYKKEGLAVGLCDGFAKIDEKYGVDFLAFNKTIRESEFPIDHIRKASEFKCQSAQAARDEDARNIRNAITGQKMDQTPPIDHPAYHRLNNVLRGRFVVPSLSRLLKEKMEVQEMKKYFDILKDSEMDTITLEEVLNCIKIHKYINKN